MLASSTVENYLKAIYLGVGALSAPYRLLPMGHLAAALGSDAAGRAGLRAGTFDLQGARVAVRAPAMQRLTSRPWDSSTTVPSAMERPARSPARFKTSISML